MSKIYICHTLYQLLIALIKIDDKELNEIVLIDFDNSSVMISKIMNYNLCKLRFYSTSSFGIKALLDFKGSREIKKNFTNADDLYTFIDHRQVGAFLNRKRIKYHLIEDGYNYFKLIGNSPRPQIYSSKIIEYLYIMIMRPVRKPGLSNYCIDIEVNDIDIDDIIDSRKNKFYELSRRELFLHISPKRKNMLLDIFSVKQMELRNTKKSILILTQPLYQDKFDQDIINTEDDQLKFYSDIVSKYKKDYEIYVKVHPRDKVDYRSLNADVVFLDKDVPMELYEFVGNYEFDIGITHSSTALDYLSCVKEKIFLKDLKAK